MRNAKSRMTRDKEESFYFILFKILYFTFFFFYLKKSITGLQNDSKFTNIIIVPTLQFHDLAGIL